MIKKVYILLIIVLATIASLAYAIYAQLYLGKQPCPLCIFERVTLGTVGLFALIFLLHNPKNFIIRIYGFILLVISGIGFGVSVRHVWLINLPMDEKPLNCGMPFGIMFQRLPLGQFLHSVLKGDADCAMINWHVLGMPAPVAILLLFGIFILLSLYLIFGRNRQKRYY